MFLVHITTPKSFVFNFWGSLQKWRFFFVPLCSLSTKWLLLTLKFIKYLHNYPLKLYLCSGIEKSGYDHTDTTMNNLDFLGENAYIPKSLNPDTARGIRNCNPLNIRYNAHNNWVGKYPREYNNDRAAQSGHSGPPEFEQFHFMWQGFLAAFKLIGNTYIYRYRLNTLAAIINRWCPKGDGDNNPQAYLEKVCAWTGVGGKEPLSNADPRLKNIVMAMAVIESGAEIKHYKADLDRAFEEYKPIKAELRGAPKKYFER